MGKEATAALDMVMQTECTADSNVRGAQSGPGKHTGAIWICKAHHRDERRRGQMLLSCTDNICAHLLKHVFVANNLACDGCQHTNHCQSASVDEIRAECVSQCL